MKTDIERLFVESSWRHLLLIRESQRGGVVTPSCSVFDPLDLKSRLERLLVHSNQT